MSSVACFDQDAINIVYFYNISLHRLVRLHVPRACVLILSTWSLEHYVVAFNYSFKQTLLHTVILYHLFITLFIGMQNSVKTCLHYIFSLPL